MHSSDFFLFLACLASTILALIVSENLDVVGNANHFGDLYIDPGVYLAFDNRNGYIRNTFDGVVTVNGQLFVIDTGNNEGMSVTFGSGFTNNGDVVLNAASETSACDFRFTGPAFINSGHIYMGGIGNTGGSTMNIWPSLVTVPQNYGTITYAQSVSRSGGNAFFGQTGQSVLNEGTICLYQMNFYQRSKVQGTGCYSVGQDSLLIIDQANTNPLPSSQTIYLSTSSSQVSFGLSMPSNTFTIVGWGNGNKIGFLTLVLSATISGSVLTVDVGFFTFTFNVGEGYEQQYISVSSGGFSGGIFILAYVSYSQPPPSASRPSVCNDCPTIFDFPEPQRSSSSSSDISSSSEVSSSSSSSEISSSSSSSEVSSSSSSSEISSSSSSSELSSSSSSSEISSSSSSSEISSSSSSSEISSSSSSSEVSSSSFESSSSYSSSSVESSVSSVSSTSSSFISESSFSSSSIVVSSSSSSHEQSSSQVTFSVESSSSSTTIPDIVSNSCPVCSRYTTTFTLTEIGTERIVSGVVVITTTEGLLTTVTSLFPEESPLTSSSSQTPSPVSDISASTTRTSSDSVSHSSYARYYNTSDEDTTTSSESTFVPITDYFSTKKIKTLTSVEVETETLAAYVSTKHSSGYSEVTLSTETDNPASIFPDVGSQAGETSKYVYPAGILTSTTTQGATTSILAVTQAAFSHENPSVVKTSSKPIATGSIPSILVTGGANFNHVSIFITLVSIFNFFLY
ncbi:hypothetical protein A9F13_03g03762 [Clavispora lusitaniae]|uniref:Hyphally-regulated cell wall protein N-terminal domain-containing protein n=1 Tax=Clavispora lusitaniae TaxID=36911 RepID=A0AA91T3E3_CLALS|nr:hypothetical protein A9F13_03g03762 [Clavispora lusitaniae]